jgi:hypothetical protein
MSKNLTVVLLVLALSGCGGGSNSVVLDVVSNGWESVQAKFHSSIAVVTGLLTVVTSSNE